MSELEGILPLAKVTHLVEAEWVPQDPRSLFRVGSGTECGTVVYRTYVCHSALHGPVVLRVREKCEEERACPTCSRVWAWKEAHVASERLYAYMRGGRLPPRHIVCSQRSLQASPPKTLGDVTRARKSLLRVLRGLGVEGGLVIYHGWRWDRLSKRWRVGPHWHVFAYGRVDVPPGGVSDWVIKTKRHSQDSPLGTIAYLLNHCGVAAKGHALAWFGSLGYRSFKGPKRRKGMPCPECGCDMEYLGYYVPEDNQPMVVWETRTRPALTEWSEVR